MIRISDSARNYLRQLLEREAVPGLGVRLSALHPGTPAADARLEFAEPHELDGNEAVVDYEGFTLYVRAASLPWLEGAEIDYLTDNPTQQQLTIKAPLIKGKPLDDNSSMMERVQWLIEHEINPQLARHGGRVAVQDVSADGVAWLRFGGGCHGCGMADVTLKQGIEKTLLAQVPGLRAVCDATDHNSGQAPYIQRHGAASP